MIRRFVNVVAGNYKTGVYSLHRLDVGKHLFHQSRADARVVPLLAEAQDNTAAAAVAGDEQPMLDGLQVLPPATTKWSSSNAGYFSRLSSACNECRILCINKVGAAVLYDAHSNSTSMMPWLSEFKGSVPVAVSISPDGAMEDDLYFMHGGPDGLDLRFNVLRFGTVCRSWTETEDWYWQSLPQPPFVNEPHYKPAPLSSYTVVDGGRTIWLSSMAEGIGTYYFNTVSCEWKRAGDWVLPFTGRAEHIPYLNLWLGFSLCSPGYLCAASGLSDMVMDQQSVPTIVWPDHTPKDWMAVRVKLLNLGPGKFAIVKVFKVVHKIEELGLFSDLDTVEDELVLTGVELCGSGNNNLQGLKMFQHKSISYTCGNSTSIHSAIKDQDLWL